MNNERLVKQIDEFMALNRQCRQDGNDILNKVRGVLTKHNSDEYERGLKDCWELTRAITFEPDVGGMSYEDIWDCFGVESILDIFDKYSVSDAVKTYKEYMKEKEEKKKAEESKLVHGDVVKVVDKRDGDNHWCGIYLGYGNQCYYVLGKGNYVPSAFHETYYTLTKIGQHVDLEGWTLND